MTSIASLVLNLKGVNILRLAGVTTESYRQAWLAFVREKAPNEELSSVWLATLILCGGVTTRAHRFLKVLDSVVERSNSDEKEGLKVLHFCV